MYCGHCGAPVGEQDTFCNTCGARFIEPAPLPPPTSALAAPAADPTTLLPPTGEPPTGFVPLTPGPDRRRWRAFAIGAAFALVAVAGVVAFFALRGDETSARPDPTGPTVLETSTSTATTTTRPPTTPAPTTAQTTVPATTAPATTVPPTPPPSTVPAPATTAAGPTPTVAPITTVPDPNAPTTVAAAPAPTAAPTTPRATAAPTTRPGPTTTAVTGDAVPRSASKTVSAVQSSATRGDSIDSCGKPTDYSPINVLDGQLDSAWMTVGDGGGQHLDFTLRKGVEVTTVGLVPGYAKQDPCSGSDRFLDMRRIAEVSWTFDGGEEVVQDFDVDSPTMQTIELPAPIKAKTVRMTIRVTTPPGTAGFDYAPVSEVTLS